MACYRNKNTVSSPNSTWIDSTLLDTTRYVRRVEPMHFGCVKLVEQHSSTRSTGSTRRARQARHNELYGRDLQLSYDHRNSCIVQSKLFTDLLEYTFI